MQHKPIIVANPHGFCAGVRRAIDSIDAALGLRSAPVYCLNEIVHNRQVVDGLAARGVVFVRDLDEVPPGACVVFSAHGVAPTVREIAGTRQIDVLDATCPFVDKLHGDARAFASRGYTILLIGYRGHDEIIGIAGEAPENVIVIENREEAQSVVVPNPEKVAVLTQTTLSVDETAHVMEILQSRFPHLEKPPTVGICRATINRQEAVKLLAGKVDLILVLGSRNSSNTRRLAEVASASGARAFLIDSLDALRESAIDDAPAIGITAGASTPEEFIVDIVEALKARGFDQVEHVTATEETTRFALPRELRNQAARSGSGEPE